uniref:Secretory peptide n=1 Tax=Heteropoda venatoria TaxID=152925 RepID=A0A088BP71_HETVE|nr:secretory peptide [Heteropoda venatoria]
MLRYILFSFCLIFCFRNKVQANRYGTADTSSGSCDLTDFNFGQVKVGEEKYEDSRCELAICVEGSYTIRSCNEVPDFDENKCEVFTKSGRYPDCCPVVVCEKKDFYNLAFIFFSTLKRLLNFRYI